MSKYLLSFFMFCLIANSYAFAAPIKSTSSISISIDAFLREKIEFFGIQALKPLPKNPNTAQLELGRRLFMETELSGNRNISCMTCHHPRAGTSDLLPLSRTHDNAGILRRNSQSLFNLGHHSFMFWDGRVHFDSKTNIFTTPEKNLPSSITNVLTSALSAQAMFPMVSREEMRGAPGENEIADAKTNLEAWEKIVTRLLSQTSQNPRHKSYPDLFKQAYPQVQLEKINIAHVAEAIGAFEKEQFQSLGSPFFRYLNGETSALSDKQKRGFVVFVDSGKCIACHQGGELGNNSFFTSVGVPQWGADPVAPDKGRGEIGGETFRNYFFRTPSLLNAAYTAPYMHNGAFLTLRDVINHYSNIRTSLEKYEIPPETYSSMPVAVSVMRDPLELQKLWSSIQAPFLRQGLMLSEGDKDDLEAFLTEALSDPQWKNQ